MWVIGNKEEKMESARWKEETEIRMEEGDDDDVNGEEEESTFFSRWWYI